jgi:hypothetical protein
VDKAQFYWLRSRTTNYANKNQHERNNDAEEVGQLVLSCSAIDRASLQTLTSADAATVRWPNHDYVHYLVNHKTKEVKPDPNYRYLRKRARYIKMS